LRAALSTCKADDELFWTDGLAQEWDNLLEHVRHGCLRCARAHACLPASCVMSVRNRSDTEGVPIYATRADGSLSAARGTNRNEGRHR
jgi:hypothetical protein